MQSRLDDMRMSMARIGGTKLLLMEGQDRMSNRVAGAQKMVEQELNIKGRSGQLTRRLADRLPRKCKKSGLIMSMKDRDN